MKKPNLAIGEAVEALNLGLRVRRQSWDDDKKFIFRQVPAEITSEIVPKMQSLPQSVKDYFEHTFRDENSQISAINYQDQIALVGLSNTITGFTFSNADVLATDWNILD